MGVPRCHRCGVHHYSGEITIDTRSEGGVQRTSRTYSLCGDCFPTVTSKLHGIMDDHHVDPPGPENRKNVFEGVTIIKDLPTGDHRRDFLN